MRRGNELLARASAYAPSQSHAIVNQCEGRSAAAKSVLALKWAGVAGLPWRIVAPLNAKL
jgi:hypothetical protein